MSDRINAYSYVLRARSSDKITVRELIGGVTDDFIELHGDRNNGDDPAVIGGIGLLSDQPVTIVGIQKGQSTKENIACHFGCAEPEGYRKALRLMKQAKKFNRPIITLINTPGAFPGVDAEYHGQGSAISKCLLEGIKLPVPYISVIIGEGGSGGALALAVGDCVWMFENSVYSILSPEGYASILWKDRKRSKEAAECMGLTPRELLKQGIVDRIVPEVKNDSSMEIFKEMLIEEIMKLRKTNTSQLLTNRASRYRNF